MMEKLKHFFCLLLLLGSATCTSYGQGWIKHFEDNIGGYDYGFDVQQTIDGGYIIAGRTGLVKTDVNGDTLWTKYDGETYISVQQTTDGGYILGGNNLVKTDANGDTLWTKNYNNFPRIALQTVDGGYIFFGGTYLVKTDANGDTLWTKNYRDTTKFKQFSAIQQTTDGGYILAGRIRDIASWWTPGNSYLVKTDANGDTLWTRTYGESTTDQICSAVEQTTDGGYILAGSISNFPNWNAQMYLIRTNLNGDTLWTKTFIQGGISAGLRDIEQTNDGGWIMCGYNNFSVPSSNLASKVRLIKIDGNGDTLWTNTIGRTIDNNEAYAIATTSDSGFIITGIYQFEGRANTSQPAQKLLIKTDSLGHVYTNTIQGNIFQDNNTDCANNTGDINLSGIIVKAESTTNLANPIFYATTDSLGNYSMLVDSGTYTITVESLLPYHNFTCQTNGITINLPGFYQPPQVLNFPLNPIIQCPLLQVDISAPIIRQTGVGSFYNISYCNIGTDSASNAYVEVDFDPNLSIIGSSIPIGNQNGNLYTFNIGNVGIGNCGSFNVQVIGDSTTLLGQAICSDVHIYPDSICLPNYWNGAILDVEAACTNDTVTFTIQNKGAPMSQGTQYFVYEDDIIFRTGVTPALLTNATDQIKEYAKVGKTYRLDVGQQANFPNLLGDPTATAVVEGCNPYPNGTFNVGFVTNLSNGSSSPFIAIDCQPLVTSYDPNDKSAQPEGYNTPHYIYNYTALDYKVRFQNTGTDTAFRVVIRDTLSAYLDVASIQMGASSHNYTWRVYGSGILEITFDNIMLPDSNVNELASNGFVRFRINQTPNNVDGTVIYNDAAIYFDYNAPIITNETFHTIGSAFVTTMLITGTENILVSQDVQVKVYPNPFKDQATLEVVGGDYQEVQLTIYDITGRNVLQYISTSGDHKIAIQRNNLPSGVYIYRLAGDGELINTGKMIID